MMFKLRLRLIISWIKDSKRAEEKRNRPPIRAQQRNIIIELVVESSKKAKTELEENLKKAESEVMEGSSKRVGEELEQENEEEVAIDAVPLATKPPTIVDWKIHKEGKKSYYQIIRADGKSQMYRVFSQMLKSFSREDLEDLYKLVKAKYGSTRPVEDLDLILYGDLKTMFEPHVEDQVWKNQDDYNVLDWKLYDSCGVHSLRMQHVYIHMLVEKRYPLTPSTITDMLNKKLQLSMKKLEILKKNIKFRGGLLGLKDFLMILELLLLSYYCSKIKTAERVSTVRERIKTEERIKIVWRSRLLT
ncbi:hypothetical protein Tco_0766323 [Tanacetum coccineum]